MSKRRLRRQYAAGVIERQDSHILIAAPDTDEDLDRQWLFPRGPVNMGESPESAMCRLAKELLGMTVEIVVGQPPLIAELDGERLEVRYFFCGIVSGEAALGPYAEIRWVLRAHLREYSFDAGARQVADWLLTERR